jgi:hypothetical protein
MKSAVKEDDAPFAGDFWSSTYLPFERSSLKSLLPAGTIRVECELRPDLKKTGDDLFETSDHGSKSSCYLFARRSGIGLAGYGGRTIRAHCNHKLSMFEQSNDFFANGVRIEVLDSRLPIRRNRAAEFGQSASIQIVVGIIDSVRQVCVYGSVHQSSLRAEPYQNYSKDLARWHSADFYFSPPRSDTSLIMDR